MAPHTIAPGERPGGDVPAGSPYVSDDALVGGWGEVAEGCARVAAAARRDLYERFGLDQAEFDVLVRLSRSIDVKRTPSQLAAAVSFSSGGFTKLADRLEKAGLVRRMPCKNDRRVIWIVLTAAGLDLARRAAAHHAAFLRANVLEVLGGERFFAVADAMRALRDASA